MNKRTPEEWLQCPKCKKFSGDDWSQCNGSCPVKDSPHFRQAAATLHGSLIKMTQEEVDAAIKARYQRIHAEDEEIPF